MDGLETRATQEPNVSDTNVIPSNEDSLTEAGSRLNTQGLTQTSGDAECSLKPCQIGDAEVDAITVGWNDILHQEAPDATYQLRYKDVTDEKHGGRWMYRRDLKVNRVTLDDLPSNSRFICQVRMVTDDEEYRWSQFSDKMPTLQSAADKLFPNTPKNQSENPEKRQLPFQEEKVARHEEAKTRKFFLGTRPQSRTKEMTIMLLGPTGAGKSTLVDGFFNYVLGVSWQDSFRVTVKHPEADELKADGNQAKSQTSWITCYTIYPSEGCRIDYKLTIIDTPGYGSVEGIEADIGTTQQIQQLFENKGLKGVQSLDAVGFVTKSPDARLTPTQLYIFNSILSIFGNDMLENFLLLMTFSDGKRPEVLAALKEAKLPCERYFNFNSSCIFAANTNQCGEESERTKLDWNMGKQEFKKFFEELEKLDTKSLALSKEVLQERKLLEITVENMQCKLQAAITMVDNLGIEIQLFKDNKIEIEKHKDFTYEINETRHEVTQSKNCNLNCKLCQSTCHKNCWAFDFDIFKNRCASMQGSKCTQCLKKCPAKNHVVERYLHEFITSTVTKTYEDKKAAYEQATKKELSHKELIENMENDLQSLSVEIDCMIETTINCKKRLQEIALRQDPLSVPDYFDDFITEERKNGRKGWQNRVKVLEQLKQEATVRQNAETEARSLQDKIQKTSESMPRDLKTEDKKKSSVFYSVLRKIGIKKSNE